MKYFALLNIFLLAAMTNLSAQKVDMLNFSDTAFKIESFHPFEDSWVIIDAGFTAYFYANPDSNLKSIDNFLWKKTLSASEFEGKVWTDPQHVFFQNKNVVERIDKNTGKLMDEIQFKGISSAPYYKEDMVYFMGSHNNENALICYNTKKKKVNWAFPAPHHFHTPVYTSRYIYTRDSFDTPVTVSYDDAKAVYPAMYEKSCPFNSWNDMFFANGNDYDDSVFYLNGFIYAVNYKTGFLRKYLPTQYPVPVVSVTLNNFAQGMDFTYAYDKDVHVFYNHFGFQLVTETDLDSLKKIKPKKALLTPMPVNPLRKHDFYKIKSTTEMGSFNDFGSSKIIGIVDNQYLVFSQNNQLIGVSSKMGRTFNFPKTHYTIDNFWKQGNILYFYSTSYNVGLIRVEMNRIWTEEELEQLKPPQEVLDKYPHLQNKSE